MTELSYTLVSDGSADRALIPLLNWLIAASGYSGSIQGECCDFRLLPRSSRPKLSAKILYGLTLYPCDLLFVHRDAERVSREKRVQEIGNALDEVFRKLQRQPHVCVIPVRMTEAWLLFNEAAIRRAAGNPHGREPLDLPRLSQLERLSKPKDMLHRLIRQAAGLGARRRETLRVGYCVNQITQHIEDFSRLRALKAFALLESEIRQILPVITVLPQNSCTPDPNDRV